MVTVTVVVLCFLIIGQSGFPMRTAFAKPMGPMKNKALSGSLPEPWKGFWSGEPADNSNTFKIENVTGDFDFGSSVFVTNMTDLMPLAAVTNNQNKTFVLRNFTGNVNYGSRYFAKNSVFH